MLKKFLTCFSLLFVLALASTAQAKPAELTGINAYDLDRETVRIEISYRDGRLDTSDVSSEFSAAGMKLDLDNALPGRVSRVSGIQIQSGAKSFIEKISVNETAKRHTSIRINFKSAVSSGDATIDFEPANRAEKKDARIIVDVKKSPARDERSTEDFSGDGRVIVLDPGHGGSDAGAIGPTGVMEKNVTLKVSLELKRLLEAEGATVILTREGDTTVSEKGAKASDIEELGARCDVANRNKADIFISIHADAFTRPEARGTTSYYYSKSTSGRGQKLADCIRRNLVEQLGTPSRGTQPCNFYVVKNTDMPATLIELGFISNKEEEKLLDSKEGVQKAAQGILDGIEDYFG